MSSDRAGPAYAGLRVVTAVSAGFCVYGFRAVHDNLFLTGKIKRVLVIKFLVSVPERGLRVSDCIAEGDESVPVTPGIAVQIERHALIRELLPHGGDLEITFVGVVPVPAELIILRMSSDVFGDRLDRALLAVLCRHERAQGFDAVGTSGNDRRGFRGHERHEGGVPHAVTEDVLA